jgi:hypothetical protein
MEAYVPSGCYDAVMDRERDLALRARLRALDIQAPDHLISAMVELGDELPSDDAELLAVLEELGVSEDSDSRDFGEPESLVRAPIRPRPSLNSGAIKLPKPEQPKP